ncbi:class II fructose-bisphosphate aldolase [Selenomonas sp. oral taxon 138]|uniref:class II fructose-bisphosphate aldolase n=1 Tax=Selenomonas sp. oral taxon 138 TaxID=712532 RepID=UPI0002A20286|nr:class II fructose-bisphosphate aldolase [Selenomonas sp. oral taxon 138]EKX96651.1 putative tagatose-bisphosphate aldolase [Selenomonas sp. oral taxon 138 str. F0429]
MLVDGKSVLDAAKVGHYGIVAPDFLTLNAARVFAQTADALRTPILLSFAQGHAGLISLEEAALVGKYWAEKVATPIVLHLDHGQDFDFLHRAIELGFTSVMLDASMKDMDENIRLTKEVVAYAHTQGVSVEAEIGHVGGASEGVEGETSESVYTTVEEAVAFVEATGVDSLAVSVGTSHGVYKSNKTPELNFERLRALSAAVPVPLVLHGGSGTGDENLRRAVRDGITKLNVYTDFLVGAMAEIKAAHTDSLIETQKAADEGMRKVLTHYINLISKIA